MPYTPSVDYYRGMTDDDLVGAAALLDDPLIVALRERVEDLSQVAAMVDGMAREIAELEARVDGWKADALAMMERLP
jgi:hypothetical protein